MNSKRIWQDIQALPEQAQQQALDFVAFLRTRYAVQARKDSSALTNEPFIGMWRGRADLRDSRAWVRAQRACPKDGGHV